MNIPPVLLTSAEARQKEFTWLLHNDNLIHRLNRELSERAELSTEARLLILLFAKCAQMREASEGQMHFMPPPRIIVDVSREGKPEPEPKATTSPCPKCHALWAMNCNIPGCPSK